MDLKDIQALIKFVSKSEVAEVKFEIDNVKIQIKNVSENSNTSQQAGYIQSLPMYTEQVAQNQSNSNVANEATVPNKDSQDDINNDKYVTIKAEMVGTFYRKPAPDKELFVKEGDTIQENTVVCVIEAMKLFNSIEAEVSGKIVKILVEDATPVEFGQPLFLVDPS